MLSLDGQFMRQFGGRDESSVRRGSVGGGRRVRWVHVFLSINLNRFSSQPAAMDSLPHIGRCCDTRGFFCLTRMSTIEHDANRSARRHADVSAAEHQRARRQRLGRVACRCSSSIYCPCYCCCCPFATLLHLLFHQ